MKVKYLKVIGNNKVGDVGDIGRLTARRLIAHGFAEELDDEVVLQPQPRRGPGRPRKIRTEQQEQAT